MGKYLLTFWPPSLPIPASRCHGSNPRPLHTRQWFYLCTTGVEPTTLVYIICSIFYNQMIRVWFYLISNSIVKFRSKVLLSLTIVTNAPFFICIHFLKALESIEGQDFSTNCWPHFTRPQIELQDHPASLGVTGGQQVESSALLIF